MFYPKSDPVEYINKNFSLTNSYFKVSCISFLSSLYHYEENDKVITKDEYINLYLNDFIKYMKQNNKELSLVVENYIYSSVQDYIDGLVKIGVLKEKENKSLVLGDGVIKEYFVFLRKSKVE